MAQLTDHECRELVGLARRALEARVKGDRGPKIDCTGALALRRRVFVSIHRNGDLRGCLGRVSADMPLGLAVTRLASAVADSDPRFSPVTSRELAELLIEISVLTEPSHLTTVSEIEIGRHGLIVEEGSMRGLLLPQVAVEHGWDIDEFLAHTCRKAGLPHDAWTRGARVHTFEAQVFGEAQSEGTSVI